MGVLFSGRNESVELVPFPVLTSYFTFAVIGGFSVISVETELSIQQYFYEDYNSKHRELLTMLDSACCLDSL